MAFTPHTAVDIKAMLDTIGVSSINDLFSEIPNDLRSEGLNIAMIPDAINEMSAARELSQRAKRDEAGLCFIGAGAYQHHIPAAVWQIAGRGEFLTAYTPYQAEASQGTLQLLYEYQSMMASLMGLDASNASLYDGASALAEAVLMAVRANRKSKAKRVLLPVSLHPNYRKVVRSIVSQQQIEIIEVPYDPKQGMTLLDSLRRYEQQDITALIIPQPNFFGVVEDVDAQTDWAHQQNALVVAVVNPLAMALLKEPGSWGATGADIACGEGQPLGVPLASGGPYFGFLAAKNELVRQMPGRIIGRTVDKEGKPGFTLTLQAREQHIRRSKATSNICTNQGLLVTAATIYMSLLGPEGLRTVAGASHTNTVQLVNELIAVPGVTSVFTAPYFHEHVLRLEKPADQVLKELNKQGIQGGYAMTNDYPELGECILVCATETKTADDIADYQKALAAIF
jgi:glycine dehydrogenase subunit 1